MGFPARRSAPHGLVLEDAATGRRDDQRQVRFLARDDLGGPFDLVIIPVRRDQLDGILPLAAEVDGDVLIFGNTAGRVSELTPAPGGGLFRFPAAGGGSALLWNCTGNR